MTPASAAGTVPRRGHASPETGWSALFRHPFLERDSLGILADHVTLEQGTGAVHTAPGHGQEDYVSGRQYGIETYCPVDAAGRFYHAEGAAGTLPEASSARPSGKPTPSSSRF